MSLQWLDWKVSLDVSIEDTAVDQSFLRTLTFVGRPAGLDPGLEGTYTYITDIGQLSSYFDGIALTQAQKSFEAGISGLWIFVSVGLTDLTDQILEDMSNNSYTLCFSTEYSLAEVDAALGTKWKGVVSYSSNSSPWAEPTLTAWASVLNHMAVYDPDDQGVAPYILGSLFSGSNWSNLQYLDMTGFTQSVLQGEWQVLYDSYICFVGGEVGKPELGLFAIGGKAGADAYIRQSLKVSIQSAISSWIKANNPTYVNSNISFLEDLIRRTARTFVNQGLIREIGKIQIPPVEEQLTVDKAKFIVAQLEVDFVESSAIWRIKGQVKGV